MIINIVFWTTLLGIVYTYFIYAIILYLVAKVVGASILKKEIYPYVSILIAAYNEEKDIKNKIEDSLQLDYPKDKLEIVIVSDGSTDKTNEIVKSFSNQNIQLLEIAHRKGKTNAQNEAVNIAKGEIVIFSDATTVYKKDLIKKMVMNFSDPSVGAVGGELVYINKDSSSIGEGNGLYWRYEKFLKQNESIINSLIGVSGCCYAIRKELYEPINPELISDFVIAQLIYIKHKRVIYEPEAISYEDTNTESRTEFKMRIRVAVRTLNGLMNMSKLLNPFHYGFYSFQLLSHKVLRYLVPMLLTILFASNLILIIKSVSIVFKIILLGQLIFYSLAFIGYIIKSNIRPFSIPYYFCMTNIALFIGILQFALGEKKIMWNPIRK